MKKPPEIVVQLVHIQGPLKGEIQEFDQPVVTIGRNPSCDLHFPKDHTAISRMHARIIREGNRFKLVDESTNGTLVNGKRLPESFLKDGDVLTFSEAGPKVSFLTKKVEPREGAQTASRAEGSTTPASEPQMAPDQKPVVEPAFDSPPPKPDYPAEPVPPPSPPTPETAQVPLVIQYGPTLRSFKTLPVQVGSAPGNDFALDHDAISDRHAQFFFAQGRYFVKDLSGRGLVSINGTPVDTQTSINPEDILTLSPQGPVFRFLSGGRLVEVDTAESDRPAPEASQDNAGRRPESGSAGEAENKAKGIFRKFLRR